MLVLTLCIVCTECSFNFNWVRFLVVLLSMYKTFIAIYLTDQQHFEVFIKWDWTFRSICYLTASSPKLPMYIVQNQSTCVQPHHLNGYPSIQTSHILRNTCGSNSLNWGQFSSVFTVSILRAATGFRNNCNHNRQRTIILNSISVDYLQLLVDIRLYHNKHNLIIEWKSTNMHYVTDSLHKLRAVFESEFEFTYGHDM